jgi:hypothetical protein
MKAWATAIAIAAAATVASTAAADDDGVYDRLSGDIDLRVGAGVAFGQGGPSFAATAGAVYLSTAGIYVHYADALGSDDPTVARSFAVGIHVQPVFVARYLSAAERGPAHLDLALDSLAFEVGTFWAARRDHDFASEPGVEIALTGGVPILPRSNGPWIEARGALRWRAVDQREPGNGDVFDRGGLLTLTLGWHQVARVHLVDAGDAIKR